MKPKFLYSPQASETSASGGSKEVSGQWSAFDISGVGAETPFEARGAGQTAVVVINQYGQILVAESRRLLGWTPSEMRPVSP